MLLDTPRELEQTNLIQFSGVTPNDDQYQCLINSFGIRAGTNLSA